MKTLKRVGFAISKQRREKNQGAFSITWWSEIIKGGRWEILQTVTGSSSEQGKENKDKYASLQEKVAF